MKDDGADERRAYRLARLAELQKLAGPQQAAAHIVTVGHRRLIVSAPVPAGPADWAFWRDVPKAELWQIVALSLGVEPGDWEDVFGDGFNQAQAAKVFPPGYWRRLVLARAHFGDALRPAGIAPVGPGKEARAPVRLSDFGVWSKGLAQPLTLPIGFPIRSATDNARAPMLPGAVASPSALEAIPRGARTAPPPLTPAPAGIVKHSTIGKRRDSLYPAIELAQSRCKDAKDTAEVWGQLQALAQAEHPPFLGITPDGLKYTKDGDKAGYLKRDALDKRLHPEKRRKRHQPPQTAA